MPEISRFFGIVIRMYFADHPPPHFHAEYGGERATIEIATLEILSGSVSPRAYRLIAEWAGLHSSELMHNWNELSGDRPPARIAPLE